MKQLKITQSITNRDAKSLDKYLHEVGKVDLITGEEEAILAKKIREGDQAALHRLIKTNLRFVISVAKQYQNQGLALGDLTNEGNLGLIKAAERFDESKGFKFISYAVWWIRQTILQAIAEQSRIVRLPLNQVGALSKASKKFSKLEQELQRDPSLEEWAEALEVSVDKLKDTISNAGRAVSFDMPLFGSDSTDTLYEVIANEGESTDQGLMDESLSTDLKAAVNLLSERTREIIILFFGLTGTAMSLDEIGEKFNITRERALQIKDAGLVRLRTKIRTADGARLAS